MGVREKDDASRITL